MRILFALPGLHRVDRGAEIAFISIATELSRLGEDVTLIGSGPDRPGTPYRYLSASAIERGRFESFPKVPALRGDTAWEEATFIPGFLKAYRPQDYDVTLTCSYPFLNWALRARKRDGARPAHVFVTQNSDWPARSNRSEYRFFGCDGLICTNPDYFEANKSRYRSALISNGVDLERFHPRPPAREAMGLPEGAPLVLMVSALIESKMVGTAIKTVSQIPDVHLAVAGDGPLRDVLRAKAQQLMPGRYHSFTVSADRMPELYSSADVFLHLSRDESFGNVFVEAMACGVPIVAWDLERTRWIIGDTGQLAADRDLNDLVKQISDALQQPRPVTAMVERATRFAWPSIAEQYRDFLKQVVDQRAGARA